MSSGDEGLNFGDYRACEPPSSIWLSFPSALKFRLLMYSHVLNKGLPERQHDGMGGLISSWPFFQPVDRSADRHTPILTYPSRTCLHASVAV